MERFNLWYNNCLPALLRVPGYTWGQRYVHVEDRTRFTVFCGVRGEEDLPSMVDWESPQFHPICRAEFAQWQDVAQGLSDRIANVYEQIAGPPLRDPFLSSDRVLSVVTVDADASHEEEWNRWYDESYIANLLKVPGYVMAARFRAMDHPAATKLNTGPRYLTVYGVEGEAVVPSLRYGPDMGPEARAEAENWFRYGDPISRNLSGGFYKMISKYFQWQVVE